MGPDLVARDEAVTVQRDDVEIFVVFARLVCTADIRRSPVAAIATCTREQTPMRMIGRRRFAWVLQCLEHRAVMSDDVPSVRNLVRVPGPRDGHTTHADAEFLAYFAVCIN